ncbi:MAG TPA: DEAD/DEAH box helicase [Candidatus Tyrphobacter sp.]|nr:DEAD/DEAH box helicase [Candidatus Tyrphobacter sp.]
MSNPSSFHGLGIAPGILGVLDKLDFKVPTPIQEKSIPPLMEGKDIIGLAQTGTGKTLAFGVPMIQAALSGKRGLIILPTRELAIQVEEMLSKIGSPLGVRTALLVGGDSMFRQIQALRRNPMIVVGTPGRMIDHLKRKTIDFASTSVLVVDEADRLLDMGFVPQLRQILAAVPHKRQTMLFSATMPQEIVSIANSYMKLPVRIEIARSGTVTENVTQEIFFVEKSDKPRLLEKLLYEYKGSVLVFSRTKFGAKRIAASIRALGHTASELHSDRSPGQRREALEGFKNGRYRVLVATDIAARGIDVKDIELVLNYDLPMNAEDYVHRIGRTARAGASGHAISFATPDQKRDVRDIERLIKIALPPSKLPELPPAHGLSREKTPYREFTSPRPRRPRYSPSTRPGFSRSGPRRTGSRFSGSGPRRQGYGNPTRRSRP